LKMKRLLALLVACCLVPMSIMAEEDDDVSDDVSEETISAEEEREVEELDAVDEDDEETVFHAGSTYQEAELSDFDENSTALYTCHILAKSSLFAERSTDAAKVTYNEGVVSAEVLYVGSSWVIVRYKQYIGFINRSRIYDVKAIDSVNTPPYGTQKSIYIATTASTCHVRKSMSDEDDSWVVLNEGTMLSIWRIEGEWAIVPYWRTYGYIHLTELTDFIPVSPTDEPLSDDTPIAAYTSYYKMVQTKSNISRINNIKVACERLTRVMQPGESLNFNKDVGPYKKSLGYQEAPVLIDGTSRPGYGGGTCQVSSTLYNALLQLPGVEILQRRPHGPGGASYLPHGVDAAVGNSNLNLRFRNNYDFPIRVEGHTSDDGALLMVIYKVSE
jgi:hypothetical protein